MSAARSQSTHRCRRLHKRWWLIALAITSVALGVASGLHLYLHTSPVDEALVRDIYAQQGTIGWSYDGPDWGWNWRLYECEPELFTSL